ncbi:hypothetical protein [Kitasatospora sp. MBT66]|uniref:hypothetical protein n=1 Tax=Kitasatospora sp. MBT66 TaxID=1444769 RepID=UPI0011EA62E5|nr:hypothetical protein [Kitasatospora sp. MBT66]
MSAPTDGAPEAPDGAAETDPGAVETVLPDPIALPAPVRDAHRSTARWAAERFLSVIRRISPAVVFDRWGQPVGIPAYGSPAFSALAPADPRREAALVTAAEAWRQQAEQAPEAIHARLRTDLVLGERARAAWAAEDEAAWKTLVRTVRAWSNHPTALELAEQRARAAEAAHRPVSASPGWPPVAIPGQPGWHRHHRPDGRQADLPDTTAPELAESA